MFRSKSHSDLLRRKRKRGSFLPVFVVIGLASAAVLTYSQMQDGPAPALSAARMVAPTADAAEIPSEPLGVQAEAPAAPSAPESVPQAPAVPEQWSDGLAVSFAGELAPSESMFLALQRKNVPAASIHAAVTALSKQVDFRRSRPGDAWEVDVNGHGEIDRILYKTGPLDIVVAQRDATGSYKVSRVEVDTKTERQTLRGTIQSSLWGAFDAAGASPNLSQTFIDTFMYTLDFNEDTQSGDTFAAVSEAVYLDGEKLKDGDLLAAKYQGQAGTFYAFAHKAKDGSVSYYDADGDSLKRQFLKSPLPVTRVTSKFGRRFHPVLKTMKMHAGVDYAAPIGTTVFAAADGTVVYAGRKGANGNLVSIRHSGGYVTHYAHLSKIQPGIVVGKRVNQRDIIAKSGNTGRSTGPHLHYGMTKNGAPVNPLTVDFTRGEPLKGNERDAFKARAKALKALLDGAE
ncbi:MAG: peptidoglycan DD-metalloendopeptidase family protein [bacterium]